jgi:hypothetical protein
MNKKKIEFGNKVLRVALPTIAIIYAIGVVGFMGIDNFKGWNSAGIILIGTSVVMGLHRESVNYKRLMASMALLGTLITGFSTLFS